MKAFSLRVIALASLPAFGACADTGSPTQEPQGLKIAVAPLELEGISDACYNILVENGEGTEFSKVNGGNDVVALMAANGAICSSIYGNEEGGDITYIAPCDASSDSNTAGTAPGTQNSVTIWPFIKGADGTVLATSTWRNPCDTDPGAEGVEGCQLHFDCTANSDTLVEFNFTIMRDAQQGFFDVAVNFEDVFCSAKLDSCYGNGTTNNCSEGNISLLHGATGRQHTAVAAFACTAGAGKTTDLLIGTPTITCTDAESATFTFTLDLDGDGNDTAVNGDEELKYAVYRGSEVLQCAVGAGTGSCGKQYLNYAINIGDLAEKFESCTLGQYFATAVERGDTIDFSAAFTSYPYVEYGGVGGVGLVATGNSVAFAYPLNAASSVVKTTYLATGPSTPTRFPGPPPAP